LSFETVEEARAAAEHYREVAGEMDWTPGPEDVLYRGYCYVAETEAAARAVASGTSFGYRPGLDRPGPIHGGFFCGCPDTVFAQIQQLHQQAGVGIVDLIFNDNRGRGAELPYADAERSLRLFAAEVLPRLRGL
jgi:alkanesulfonate monooxygenase SsuD/methylene tetrahydromethanopterin reductase-like flavin-dependent oxidoreductase (luciferase family)